jgi:hypothetical protein
MLSVIFAYISVDETVQLHERMNSWFDWGGALHFGWVVPAGILVALLGFSLLGFLSRLPHSIRWRMLISAALFIRGAIGVELILGWWTDSEGADSLIYALIDWVEETLELTGIGLFVYTLLIYAIQGEPLSASTTDRFQWANITLRRAAAVMSLWVIALISGAMLVSGGFHTYYQYEDHRGFGPLRAEYLGPDLRDELRAGERFAFAREVEKFDRNVENRLLIPFGLGVLSLIGTALCLVTRPRPSQS